MTTYHIERPEKLRATVCLPASKSISNRALVISALSGGGASLQNLSDCDDTAVVIKALELLRDSTATGTSRTPVIDIKAAGTAMRFMTSFLAATPPPPSVAETIITGTERMKHRPIKVLVDALRHLGADIAYEGEEGFPPLRIAGKRLEGGTLQVDGNISSQFISALLLIGPVLKKGLTLRLTGDIISHSYIDLTLWTMREFGADAEWTAVDTIEVKPKPYTPRTYHVESDWSAASYWYEMVALTADSEAEVRLQGLTDGSKQGDSSVRYIFSLLGVRSRFSSHKTGVPTTLTLTKSSNRVKRLEYDFENAPDLAQTIVCTCCALGIPFHFTGLQTLKIKETDRIEALKTELLKLGFVLSDIGGRELVWNGERTTAPLHHAEPIDTYEDHRMALAFAPMALVMPISIRHPQVVSKSYPSYWDDLQQAGFSITE